MSVGIVDMHWGKGTNPIERDEHSTRLVIIWDVAKMLPIQYNMIKSNLALTVVRRRCFKQNPIHIKDAKEERKKKLRPHEMSIDLNIQ